MSRCTGARCEEAFRIKVPEDPEGPYRYIPQQCKNECAAGSSLCTKCLDWMKQYQSGKKGKWNGYINGEIPPESHVVGSEWNLKLRAKYAEKIAKGAMGEAAAAPKAKKAAKKALEAVAEAKEARSNAVDALIAAEDATHAVVKEVLRKSSSDGRGLSLLRIAIPKSSRRKTAKKSATAARTALGMAEMYSSSSSPKRRATARKAKTPKPKTAKPKTSRKTAKKSSNLMIYRPASAAPSPAAAATAIGYRTPFASASPMPPSNAAGAAAGRVTPYSSPAAAAVTGMANFNTSSSSPSPSSSSSGSNFSAGSRNLTLE